MVGGVQSEGAGEQQHSQAAAARPAGPAPIGVQSCDNIHIQMDPLHSMDAYAAKLASPGMEIAIYSGRCPLTMLATYHPPRPLQQQVASSSCLYPPVIYKVTSGRPHMLHACTECMLMTAFHAWFRDA